MSNENYLEKYKLWCENPYFDEPTRKELLKLADDWKEIEDRFYRDLEFGTGGLRGILGAGSNRMNKYTIRKATQGLANYINKNPKKSKKVAIAYDSRIMSYEFAEEAALCLNANGIETYKFDTLRPTPELSFAVRYLECTAGIVITASHNPAEYNGYKVYWEDGGQITAPLDKEIISEVNNVYDYSSVKTISHDDAVEKGLYHIISKEIDDAYIGAIKQYVLNEEVLKKEGKNLRIVYTPLHGTGNILVKRILNEIGFDNVFVVPEQERPDGNFPTVSYPNPEDPAAFELALRYAREKDADIVMATDPDADRLGIYAKNEKGEYVSFTGNMSGILIGEYILEQRKKKGILPENGALVSTIVTTNLAKAVAQEYNVKFIETLTGFKYIGEQIKKFEQNETYEYVFGLEESYGCLIGTYARDKDAVSAVMMLSEAAAYYKSQGKTLCDQMENIYKKYGYYQETLITQTLKGIEGKEKINELIEKLRNNPPINVDCYKVIRFRDYKSGKITNLENGEKSDTELPNSNVLYFELSDDSWFCARPSGTEPKIKYYIGVKGQDVEEAENKIKIIKTFLLNI